MVGRVHPVLNAEVDATTPLHATCIEEADPASRHHQVELAVEDVTAYVRSLYDHSLAREARGARIRFAVRDARRRGVRRALVRPARGEARAGRVRDARRGDEAGGDQEG